MGSVVVASTNVINRNNVRVYWSYTNQLDNNNMTDKELEEELRALFPLRGSVTQDTIDTACSMCPQDCYGARTLREALAAVSERQWDLSWGDLTGYIYFAVEEDSYCEGIRVCTKEALCFMSIKEPQEVTFILER